jgi:hypothetical protein
MFYPYTRWYIQRLPARKYNTPWLLLYICINSRCTCYARLQPDFLCVRGVPYTNDPPVHPNPDITIQYIELTYCNDRFSQDIVTTKIAKYKPLLDSIRNYGWTLPC